MTLLEIYSNLIEENKEILFVSKKNPLIYMFVLTNGKVLSNNLPFMTHCDEANVIVGPFNFVDIIDYNENVFFYSTTDERRVLKHNKIHLIGNVVTRPVRSSVTVEDITKTKWSVW